MSRAVSELPIRDIEVGDRPRRDVGDLSALTASIRERGLLVPLTVTDDRVLILGGRRLAAAQQAGFATVPCWTISGVSDRLTRLLALRDAHQTRKDLSPLEQARLYAELRELTAAEARARQEATRFGAAEGGGGDSPAPGEYGTAREKAARAVTGRDSYHQHEQVLTLQTLADDPSQPEWLRSQAAQALAEVERRRKVHGPYLQVMTSRAAHSLHAAATDPDRPDQDRAEAEQALQTLTESPPAARTLAQATRAIRRLGEGGWADVDPLTRNHLARERLLALVEDTTARLDRLDPQLLRPVLTDEDRTRLTAFTAQVTDFTASLTTASALAG